LGSSLECGAVAAGGAEGGGGVLAAAGGGFAGAMAAGAEAGTSCGGGGVTGSLVAVPVCVQSQLLWSALGTQLYFLPGSKVSTFP
jgi:hypothetical protein